MSFQPNTLAGDAYASSPLQGPPGLVWRAQWLTTSTYAIGDAVFNATDGCSYICIVGNTGTTPPNATYWSLLSMGNGGNLGAGLTVGEMTLPRTLGLSVANNLVSGDMALSYFTATKTETITKARVGVTAAAVGATKSQFCVYSTDATGQLIALLASTPVGTTTLFNAIATNIGAGGSTNEGTFSASWSKVAGAMYAVGIFFVGTTAPQIIAANLFNGNGDMGLSPPLSRKVTGQATLPASISAGGTTNFGFDPIVYML